MARDTEVAHLHPIFRRPALALLEECRVAGIPLGFYEGARGPWRQAQLYSVGRSVGKLGKTKTKARSWESKHQYGFALDGVFLVNGIWTWDEPVKGMWDDYQTRAKRRGLHVLSFEKPHVEWPISIADLEAGRFPDDGGDHAWRDHLEHQVEYWGLRSREIDGITHPGAPHSFLSVFDRPDLDAA